jgi:hypothetical protein
VLLLAFPAIVFVGATAFGAVVSLSLGILAWRRRPRPGATEFAALSVLAIGWLVAHGAMLLAPGAGAARTWFVVSQVVLTYLPVPWLLFTLAYADVGSSTRRLLAVVLSAFATLVVVSVFVPLWAGVGLESLTVVETSGVRYVLVEYRGTDLLLVGGSFLTVAAGFAVLARLFVSAGTYYRWQIGLVMLGAAMPTVASLVRVLGVGPVPGFDFAPYAFVVQAVAIFWALFGFDLLDLPPVGRAALFEQFSDPALVLDADGRIVDYNDAATALFGDGIDGRRLATVAPAVAEAVDATVPDGSRPRRDGSGAYDGVTGEVVLGVDGIDRRYELRIEPLSVGHRRSGRLCLLNDLTERIARERALERLATGTHRLVDADEPVAAWVAAVEVTREAVGAAVVGGWVRTDRDGEESLAHVAGDGSPSPAALGVTWAETDTDDRRPVVVDSADAVPSLGTVLVAPVGEWGLLLVGTDGAFDRTTDRVVDVLAANLDVSLARLTREQELADRNERLEQFSAVVSHDLRNPLSIAGGYVDLLQDREGYADAEELDRVAAAIARIEDIIGGVLALVADDEVQPEPVALRGVVTAAWGTADTADATVEYVGEDVVLAADRERLRQALENLFRNAAEHGGADVVRVGTTESGFFVEDDGSGLPADADTDVFEWGVSIDGGTGIGMAVVSHVADAHGWDVAVADPAPDRGVRIVFET